MKFWSWIAALAVFALLAGCTPKSEPGTQDPGEPPKATGTEPDAAGATPADPSKSPEPNLGNSGTVEKGGEAQPGTGTDGDAKPPKATTAPAPPPKDPPAKTQPVKDNASMQDVVGSWTMIIPGRAKEMNDDMKKKGKLPFSGKLEIKADGSYTFEFGLAGKAAKTKGKATMKNGILTLSATDDGGEKVQVKAQPKGTNYTFKLSQDGKELLSDMPARTNLGFRR